MKKLLNFFEDYVIFALNLAIDPAEVLTTKKSRKIFILLFPFWIIYGCLIFALICVGVIVYAFKLVIIDPIFFLLKVPFKTYKKLTRWINEPPK
jgi:hypothetical protein